MKTNYTAILNNSQYKSMANAIRALSMDAIENANSGHPGMPMGIADVMTILYSEFLNFNPNNPKWEDRDRLILSAGHGSMLLYSLLYLTGYKDISIEDIKQFRTLGAKTAGHPELGYLSGIETTTGPLGQGLANAVGMAISEKKLQERFGPQHVNHHTYVICGDGCLMEGISHEAISLAGHLNLNKLIVIFDDNNISIDGPTSLTISDNYQKRFEASNWNIIEINGHDYDYIRAALYKANKSDKPTLIAAKTKIGYGSPNKENTSKCHGSPLGKDEIKATKFRLDWDAKEFEIPDNILELWRSRQYRVFEKYEEWQKNATKEFNDFIKTQLPNNLEKKFLDFKKELSKTNNNEATRNSSGNIIDFINSNIDSLLGGSADLTGSNITKAKSMSHIHKDDFSGNYIYYGIREHAMIAIMNGIAIHGGYIPYGGTFLVFTDYCRPPIRLAAMMKQRVIMIMTHDSIGLGEDGPTHQPIEHLASLRAIPNLFVFRPADAIETLECWQIALNMNNAPSLFSLSRQKTQKIRMHHVDENLCQKGAYIIKEASKKPLVTIISTGSEVSIAIQAADELENIGVPTKVISMPCWELFDLQDKNYRKMLIDDDSIKVAIEAAARFGWDKYIGNDGIFIGMENFGASASSSDLYNHFKITADEIVKNVKLKLGK